MPVLGCLIFKFSVTSNNLIGSFVLPHTPNGHAGLPVLNRPPAPLVAAAHAAQDSAVPLAQCLPVAKALPLRLWPGLRRLGTQSTPVLGIRNWGLGIRTQD